MVEAIGATPQATAEIWRFLLDIDWYATLEASLLPLDHPLFLLLANPRRTAYRMGDGLWVRLVDVGAALSGRAYAGDGAIVFEVRDAVCPWNEGRWKLEGGERGAHRRRSRHRARRRRARLARISAAVSFAQLRDGLRIEELADGAVAAGRRDLRLAAAALVPEIF